MLTSPYCANYRSSLAYRLAEKVISHFLNFRNDL